MVAGQLRKYNVCLTVEFFVRWIPGPWKDLGCFEIEDILVPGLRTWLPNVNIATVQYLYS